MDIAFLYTSYEGRINRKTYLLAILPLIAAGYALLAAFFVLHILAPGARDFTLFGSAIFFVWCYPGSAVVVKRLHDRNQPGYFAAYFFGVQILKTFADLFGLTTTNFLAMSTPDYLFLIMYIPIFWVGIGLAVRRGTVGPNQYGPDPIEAIRTPIGSARTPLMRTVLWPDVAVKQGAQAALTIGAIALVIGAIALLIGGLVSLKAVIFPVGLGLSASVFPIILGLSAYWLKFRRSSIAGWIGFSMTLIISLFMLLYLLDQVGLSSLYPHGIDRTIVIFILAFLFAAFVVVPIFAYQGVRGARALRLKTKL